MSIGDDYWIENSDGDHVYRVDGKAMRVRNTLDLEDAHGTQLCRIHTRVLHIRDSMAIEGRRRQPAGPRAQGPDLTAARALEGRTSPDDAEWSVQGNIVHDEYTIEADGQKIAEISK